jgi:hypothetical protein
MMHGGNIRIYSVLFPLCSSPVQAEDAFGPAIVRTWRTRVQGRTEWIRQVFRLVPPFPAFPVVNQWRAGETVCCGDLRRRVRSRFERDSLLGPEGHLNAETIGEGAMPVKDSLWRGGIMHDQARAR